MDNVFQMLAQQELDRPRRRLQDLQLQQEEMKLKAAQDEQAYQQKFKTAMAPKPDQPLSLASLGDPTAVNVPNSPMQPQPFSLKGEMDKAINYHLNNGRKDLAVKVFNEQLGVLTEADKYIKSVYEHGGQPAVDQFLQANPHFAEFTGKPVFQNGNVLYSYQNPDGSPSQQKYRIENGKHIDVKTSEASGDTSGFQSAIAGLSGPSAAGAQYGLGTTGIKTGYAPLSEVEKDIRMAGSSYGVKGEEINKAVDDARNMYKETYVQGQRIKPKGSKSGYTPEYNLMGQQKDVGKTTDITIHNTIPKSEKDLPVGVQEKLQTKMDMANDWTNLKKTFNPSFMPNKPFKSVSEFQVNMQRVFGNNQAAIDWWTNYFDARNLLLKDRSGAAVTEPEFVRFEQGAIRANDSPQTVINQLAKAESKYRKHADSFINANEKNHPEGVKGFVDGMGYEREQVRPKGKDKRPPLSAIFGKGK